MSRAACVLLALTALAAAEPAFTVAAQEFAYGQRVDFVLGDGTRPFADEDQRRAHLVLRLRGSGRVALLGWSALDITAATSDRGEELTVAPLLTEGVSTASHDLANAPAMSLPALVLPLTRQGLRSLARLQGRVEVRFSTGEATSQRFAISALTANQDQAISGLEGGSVALTNLPRAHNAQVTVRLSRAAFLAAQDAVFLGADGKPSAVLSRRAEWRDNQGLVVIALKGLAPTTLELRWYPVIQTQRVDFTLTDLDLGFTVPGREDLRGPLPIGAEGF